MPIEYLNICRSKMGRAMLNASFLNNARPLTAKSAEVCLVDEGKQMRN